MQGADSEAGADEVALSLQPAVRRVSRKRTQTVKDYELVGEPLPLTCESDLFRVPEHFLLMRDFDYL